MPATATVPASTAERASTPPRRQSLTELERERERQLGSRQRGAETRTGGRGAGTGRGAALGDLRVAILRLNWSVQSKAKMKDRRSKPNCERVANSNSTLPSSSNKGGQGRKAPRPVCGSGQSASCALYFILHNWACNESN